MLTDELLHTPHMLAYEPDEPDNDANSGKRKTAAAVKVMAANNDDTAAATAAVCGVRCELRRENEPKNPRQII